MFDRHDIIYEQDLANAVAKRYGSGALNTMITSGNPAATVAS